MPLVSVEAFLARYPEFASGACSDRALIKECIAEAEALISSCQFGAITEVAIKAKAAALLAATQCGRKSGLASKDGKSQYSIYFESLQGGAILSARVV